MVQINHQTWVTPTSYGLVFTVITDTQELHRIYLDNDAAHNLVSVQSDYIKETIEQKGIPLIGINDKLEHIKQEKDTCDDLVRTNQWHLFSLYPLQFSIQSVNYCNAGCDFCYANVPHTKHKKTMDVPTIFQLKEYAATHGIKFGVSGGEPLLHPEIYDILRYRHQDVYDTLITNLTCPFDEKELIRSQVDLIQVSIHGHQKDHDRIIKIPNAYQKIFENIKVLFPNINMATNTVITSSNINHIPRLIKDLSDLQEHMKKSLSYVRFVPVVPSGTGLSTYTVQEGFINQVETMMTTMQHQYPELNFEIPLLMGNPYEYFFKENRWVCPAGSTVAVVRIDGHIAPCNQFLDTTQVSSEVIPTKDFQRIWLSDPLFSEMRKGIVTDHHLTCSECRYLYMRKEGKKF